MVENMGVRNISKNDGGIETEGIVGLTDMAILKVNCLGSFDNMFDNGKLGRVTVKDDTRIVGGVFWCHLDRSKGN